MVNDHAERPAISVKTECLTWQDATVLCQKDANSMTTLPQRYVEANRFQYYVLANSWLNLIHELLGERAQYSVKNSIMRDGLISCIRAAADLADQIIRYVQDGEPVSLPMSWFMPNILDINLGDALQALRYPKRFTPTYADKLVKGSYDTFKAINKYDGITNHMNYPEWLCEGIRKHMSSMCKYFKVEYAHTIPKFSSGSSTVGRVPLMKIKEYSKTVKNWGGPLYPIGNADTVFDPLSKWRYTATVAAVPKSYKAYRIIAPEHPYYAAEKQRVKDAIRASIKRTKYGKLYDPERQDINRENAFIGALTGKYATIDLTSASDSIADSFAYNIMPYDLMCVLYPFHCDYVIVDGIWCKKRMFATSGDPVCFDFEAMTFLAIALTVSEIASALTGERYELPTVYGDDIVVDSRLFESVMDVLSILRFIPNMSKSFGTGGYRESCGVEYYYGYDVSTNYWPRSVVSDPIADYQSLESLCMLQHHMFKYWRVNTFLTDVITTRYPKMTSSPAGSECSDIWADSPWYAKRSCPVDWARVRASGQEIPNEWTLREAHTGFVAEYPSTNRWDPDLDMMHYVDFLRNGPIYDDILDERQGISRVRSRDNDFSNANIKVKNIIV